MLINIRQGEEMTKRFGFFILADTLKQVNLAAADGGNDDRMAFSDALYNWYCNQTHAHPIASRSN
jgi:hypothetical protein